MADEETKQACLERLEELKANKGKKPAGCEEAITSLQNEAASRGLDDNDIELIVDVITSTDLRAGLCVPLIRCLIPKKRVSNQVVEDIINYWLKKCSNLPITVSTTIFQWLIGLWEHQLVDRQTINVYYDCFFFLLLKHERLESHIARLIYLLTKPEDVTRRQVSRLLRLQEGHARPMKHLSALLSLFKSYKPELVPEKIPSLNIESVWKPIPEVFRLGFEDAKNRSSSVPQSMEHFDWNPIKQTGSKKGEQLLPSIRYFQMGSTIYQDKPTKSIFDLSTITDVGRHYFNVELPSNATSLLANSAGYHFLTFAPYEYQSRFSHNLYTTLRRAFLLEYAHSSRAQKTQLLEMSIDFCRYMQQGIPVLTRFFLEFLPHETGDFRGELLRLLEWCTLVSTGDLTEIVAPFLDSIFLESSLLEKCAIIRSLRRFLRNLFVNQNFGKGASSSPFLGQVPVSDLSDLLPIIAKIAEKIVVKGVNITFGDPIFLNESLNFYEELLRLLGSLDTPILLLPPSPLVYGAFCSKSCAILSKICGILLKCREICGEVIRGGFQAEFVDEIEELGKLGRDLGEALWNSRVFERKGGYFENLKSDIEDILPDDAEYRLDIMRHIAILPYMCTLGGTGLHLSSKNAALFLAESYFPKVSEFIEIFDEPFQ